MKVVHVLIIGKRASGKSRLAEKLETLFFHPSQVLFVAQRQYLAGLLNDLEEYLDKGIDYVVLMQDRRNSERLIADVRRVIDDANCTPQVCEALRKANENAASPLYGYAFIDTVTRRITWQPGGVDEDAVNINRASPV